MCWLFKKTSKKNQPFNILVGTEWFILFFLFFQVNKFDLTSFVFELDKR